MLFLYIIDGDDDIREREATISVTTSNRIEKYKSKPPYALPGN